VRATSPSAGPEPARLVASHRHTYADRPHPEYVVLDIGGECGALILHTDPEMHGVEVEISRSGEARTGAHKQVLERKIGGRAAYTLLYDGLAEGRYTLWDGDRPMADVEVTGGEIAELDRRELSGRP
jgi:hypothetical protein